MRTPLPTGDMKVDAAVRALYEEILILDQKISTTGTAPKDNWEGMVGLVRIIRTETGGYALHARSEDGWVTSTNVEFSFLERNEISRRTILGAHASQHEEDGGDEIAILDLAFPGGTDYLRSDGTWSNPSTGSAITTLNTLTASTQTMTNTNDTNVTLAITQISTSEHRFIMGWSGTLDAARLASHDIITKHSASGLTTGHVLQATGATTFGFAALPAHNQSASTITAGTFASAAPSQYYFPDEVRIDGLLGVGRDATVYAIELNGSIGFYGTSVAITNAGTGHVVWQGDPIGASYIGTHSHAAGDINSGTLATARGGTNLSGFTADGLVYASSTSVLATSSNVSTDGSKLTKYNSITTEGQGVPPIVDYVVLTNYGTSITATNCTNTNQNGLYRVSVYLSQWSADLDTGTVYCRISWREPNSTTYSSVAEDTTTVDFNTNKRTNKTFVVRHDGSSYITYATTVSGIVGDDKYALWITVERLN